MDFSTVPTAAFRILYVFFVIHHSRRTILHVGVTPFPNAKWIAQQLREAFPYDEISKYLIHDRDSEFGSEVVRTIRGMDVRPCATTTRTDATSDSQRFAAGKKAQCGCSYHSMAISTSAITGMRFRGNATRVNLGKRELQSLSAESSIPVECPQNRRKQRPDFGSE